MEECVTPLSGVNHVEKKFDFDDSLMSILTTPKPQACSTVDRRSTDLNSQGAYGWTPVQPSQPEADKNSPAFLLSAINDVRRLKNQLCTLGSTDDSVKMPPPSLARKEARNTKFDDRSSICTTTDSEANSSLGIIKVDEMRGFSDTEDLQRNRETLNKLLHDNRSDLQALNGKGKVNSEVNSNTIKSLQEMKATPIDASARLDISYERTSTSSTSDDLRADLRLRMQRALAKRTINDYSQSATKTSQNGDSFSASNSSHISSALEPESKRNEGEIFSSSDKIAVPNSVIEGSSLDGFPFSISGSNIPTDSNLLESFQSGEAALQRLREDENSWQRRYADFPNTAVVNKESDFVSQAAQNANSNFDWSPSSLLSTDDFTASASIQEVVGKSRISVGEYFRLRTGQLGNSANLSTEERPNFGKTILSPPLRRPHPPLVDVQDPPLDEVPTRDAGIYAKLSSSLADTMDLLTTDCSFSSTQNSICVQQTERSVDLMPPPPETKVVKAKTRPASEIMTPNRNLTSPSPVASPRPSTSSRLSTSLSLALDTSKATDASLASLDTSDCRGSLTGVPSISQISRLLSEMNGSLTSREIIDHLLQDCRKAPESNVCEQPTETNHNVSMPKKSNPEESAAKSEVLGKTLAAPAQNPLSVDQRVAEWMSGLDTNNKEEKSDGTQLFKLPARKEKPNHKPVQQRRSVDLGRRPVQSQGSSNTRIRSLHQASSFTGGAYDADESDTSFFPLNGKGAGGSVHSTPKPHLHGSAKMLQKSSSNGALDEPRNSKPKSGRRPSATSVHSDSESSSGRRSATEKALSHSSVKSGSPGLDSRAPSACSSMKNLSRRTDGTSSSGGSLQVDTSHTVISWGAIPVGTNGTQKFSLRNKGTSRVRLLVSSSDSTFKLLGERGDLVTFFTFTLHPEVTRQISVMFSPSYIGSVIGKLTIGRASPSESCTFLNAGDKFVIPLYGYGGTASVHVEGASKDQWAQLFLNVSVMDTDAHSDIADMTIDVPQMGSSFSVRNTGNVPAFASLGIQSELPFENCGVTLSPSSALLYPGQSQKIIVTFDPSYDILQWLLTNSGDIHLLCNIRLSWAELSTWQRIRRLYLKYYRDGASGPLSMLGTQFTGSIEETARMRDKQKAETQLSQGIRCIKVAVLGEADKLKMLDLEATIVFHQLTANDTMIQSPSVDDKSLDRSAQGDSPYLSGNVAGLHYNTNSSSRENVHWNKCTNENVGTPKGTRTHDERVVQNRGTEQHREIPDQQLSTNLPVFSDSYNVLFPPTKLGHKSCAKIAFKNISSDTHHVCIRGAEEPFSVATPEFQIQGSWYFNMRVYFRPQDAGPFTCKLDVFVDGKHISCYELSGDGIDL